MIRSLSILLAIIVEFAAVVTAPLAAFGNFPPPMSVLSGLSPEGWLPLAESESCGSSYRLGLESVAVKLLSDTSCEGTRSLNLTFEHGPASFLANIAQNEGSVNLNFTLQYRLTSSLRASVQESFTTPSSSDALVLPSAFAFTTVGASPLTVGPSGAALPDTSDSATSFTLNFAPDAKWSLFGTFTVNALYTTEQTQIQYAITSNWSAQAVWSRTQGQFGKADTMTFTVSGTVYDIPVGISHTQANSSFVPPADDLLAYNALAQSGTFASGVQGVSGYSPQQQGSVSVSTISLNVTALGWQWALSATGGATPNLSLLMESLDDTLGVILSSDPLSTWVTYKMHF